MRQIEPRNDRAGFGDVSIESLILAAGDGDRQAFEELYRQSCARLLGVSLRVLGNRADAEEALQDCYVRLWRNAGQFDPARGSGFAWLTMLIRNQAIDRLRTAASGARASDRGLTVPAALDDVSSDPMLDLTLADCIAQLGDRDGAYIRSAFFSGKTYSELAREAELPLGTVKSSIRRALVRLKECLG